MILTQYGRHEKVFSTPFINQWDHELIDTTFLDLAFEHSIWQRQSFFALFLVGSFLVVSQVLLPNHVLFAGRISKCFDSWKGWLTPPPPPPLLPPTPARTPPKRSN